MLPIGLKLPKQVLHFLSDLLAGDGRIWIGLRRVTQTVSDLPQPMVGFVQVVCQRTVLGQCSIDLLGQLLKVDVLGIVSDQGVQDRGDSSQLLVTDQSTPIEWFAAVAVECVPDGQADLSFNRPEFRISLR